MTRRGGAGYPAAAFDAYQPRLKSACLRLFDANCPAFFAPNEREAYTAFLDRAAPGYFTMRHDGQVIAAFGLLEETAPDRRRLSWIMVHPDRQGEGVGQRIIAAASERCAAAGASAIDIAASHLSAPFFARHGATIIHTTPDGWGSDMHRVDMELLLANRDSASR